MHHPGNVDYVSYVHLLAKKDEIDEWRLFDLSIILCGRWFYLKLITLWTLSEILSDSLNIVQQTLPIFSKYLVTF